jgi:hypothetical protein
LKTDHDSEAEICGAGREVEGLADTWYSIKCILFGDISEKFKLRTST